MLSASGLLLSQAVLPYTFTTAELEALKTKLMSAEQQINSTNKGQHTVLQISLSEIKTLLRMIDMTYLQGLSASGIPVPQSATLPAQAIAQSQMQTHTSTVTGPGPSGQPPASYICHKCGIPGHYVQDCTLSNRNNNNNNNQQQRNHRGPPPANYVCHKCSKPGHWIQDCPTRQGVNMAGGMNVGVGMNNNNNNNNNFGQNRYQQKQTTDYSKPPPPNYVCHRCRVAGHWIRNCPTNGDPSFDKNTNQIQQNQQQTLPQQTNISSGSASNTDSTGEPPAAKKRKGLNGAAIQ